MRLAEEGRSYQVLKLSEKIFFFKWPTKLRGTKCLTNVFFLKISLCTSCALFLCILIILNAKAAVAASSYMRLT